ncbi:hypothetical protein [Roseibium sp.]|uniref:hypothetical protein n=1 Tax=Roseibium sp. TaxID=1936156 RepID=UPI003BACF95E
MTDDWKKQVFRQKSLWEVYTLSRAELPKPIFNSAVFWISAFVLSVVFVWSIGIGHEVYSLSEALTLTQTVANSGFVLAVGILGFLIAGFSIFASVTKDELFITLAKIPYRKSSINRLQFVFFNFLNVFTVYVGLLAICLFSIILFSEQSPLIRLITFAAPDYQQFAVPILFLVVCSIMQWILSAILKLKSFIWNLYQTVLVTIATESELQDQKERKHS